MSIAKREVIVETGRIPRLLQQSQQYIPSQQDAERSDDCVSSDAERRCFHDDQVVLADGNRGASDYTRCPTTDVTDMSWHSVLTVLTAAAWVAACARHEPTMATASIGERFDEMTSLQTVFVLTRPTFLLAQQVNRLVSQILSIYLSLS